MKLNYNILWFENEVNWYESMLPNIQDHLERFGFDMPKPKRIAGNLPDDVNLNTYDLILMDFNLDEGVEGNTIIEEIRRKSIYTEVVFYSTSGEREVRKKMQEQGLDGVYCASRDTDEFVLKVTKVIDTTIRKFQELVNMRGLFISETIELEIMVEDLVKLFAASTIFEDAYKETIITKLRDNKIKNLDESKGKTQSISFQNINECIDSYLLTASDFYSLLQTVLSDKQKFIKNTLNSGKSFTGDRTVLKVDLDNIQSMKQVLNDFQSEIIGNRNTLAHLQEQTNSAGDTVLKRPYKEIVFDENKFVDLRKILKKHRDNLNKIKTSGIIL